MGDLAPVTWGSKLQTHEEQQQPKHQQNKCIIYSFYTKTKCCFSSGLSAIKIND